LIRVLDRDSSPDALTALLERLRLPLAGTQSPTEVAQGHLDVLLARVAALTEAVRTSPPNETTRLAARLLLSDLALVVAQLRGDANAVGASLAETLDGLRQALDDSSSAG
jgi:hypothetical protein